MAEAGLSNRLRQAIIFNDLSLVRRILTAHRSLIYNPNYDEKSNTSLHLAASLGFTEIAQYLISLGHDSDASSPNSLNAKHGISVNTDGQTPLHLAAANGHTAVVELLCETFPTTIHRRDKMGQTSLLLAAGALDRSGHSSTIPNAKPSIRPVEDISTISTLLQYGADVTAKDIRGNTCLHNACAFGNLKAIRALMESGADPLCMNFEGWKPELYSLTVQAEVYYKNLVAEFDRMRAEEMRLILDKKANNDSIRLVLDDDEEDSDSTSSATNRSRADSGQSRSTFESAMS